jgi:hypothetical protein
MDATTLPVTGHYQILIDALSTYTGGATIALYNCTEIAGTITPGGSAVTVTTTVIGQNARLSFSGTANQRISLYMSGITIPGSAVTIYKPDGTTLASSGTITTSTAFIDTKTLPVTGTYSIFVNPTVTNTGSMTLTLYDVPADASGSVTIGGAAVPVTISVPGQNGSLTFSGTSGQQATVRITGNTISSLTVTLVKPDGTTLTSASGTTSSFNLATVTLPTTGTYTIKIDPFFQYTGSLNVNVTSP